MLNPYHFMSCIVGVTMSLIARETAAVARAIVIVKHIQRSALSNINVINWYLHFVVIMMEQNTTKAVIEVSEVNFLLQMGYSQDINIEENQILPMNNAIRLYSTCMLYLGKHDCVLLFLLMLYHLH